MILGLKQLEHQFDKLSRVELKPAVAKSITFVQSAAKAGCPVHDGELRESIHTDIQESGESVTGICFTNKEYGPYVEFGTGPKGQAHHEGISPDVTITYSQAPWWIHESQIDSAVAEKYHFFSIETPAGKFYQTSGQAAQPFMYPALKNNEDAIDDIFTEHIKRAMGETTK